MRRRGLPVDRKNKQSQKEAIPANDKQKSQTLKIQHKMANTKAKRPPAGSHES